MTKIESDKLINQIKNIALGKPIGDELLLQDKELSDLQDAMLYLSGCMLECNALLNHLTKGELSIPLPPRHNFLAGHLKELHSAMVHLTWQANQISQGDYSQRISFLGEFADAFNQMVERLMDRETKLKQQSDVLNSTNVQMKAIMDGLNEWIVVTSHNTGQVVFANSPAEMFFFKNADLENCVDGYEPIFEYIRSYRSEDTQENLFEYSSDTLKHSFEIKSYKIYWGAEFAYIHSIIDITVQKESRRKLETMSYKDELTGAYNRRYFSKVIKELLAKDKSFSMCLVDLDGLKHANDNYGHMSGDEYLLAMMEELSRVSRQSDTVCRIGGDEFAIVFPGCDGSMVFKKMLAVNRRLKLRSGSYPMQVSYGVVEVDEHSDLGIEDILRLADDRMYSMKLQHRSRPPLPVVVPPSGRLREL